MDDGVELKQLTVGVDRVGLGVGGLASEIVLIAISAASIVIVFIIWSLSIVSGCLVVIALDSRCGNPGEICFGFWGEFLTYFYENCRGKFSKKSGVILEPRPRSS